MLIFVPIDYIYSKVVCKLGWVWAVCSAIILQIGVRPPRHTFALFLVFTQLNKPRIVHLDVYGFSALEDLIHSMIGWIAASDIDRKILSFISLLFFLRLHLINEEVLRIHRLGRFDPLLIFQLRLFRFDRIILVHNYDLGSNLLLLRRLLPDDHIFMSGDLMFRRWRRLHCGWQVLVRACVHPIVLLIRLFFLSVSFF